MYFTQISRYVLGQFSGWKAFGLFLVWNFLESCFLWMDISIMQIQHGNTCLIIYKRNVHSYSTISWDSRNLDNFSEHNFQNLSINVEAPCSALNEENIQNCKEINAFAAGLFDRNRVRQFFRKLVKH